MLDKHGMLIKLLPTWLATRQHTPETCAQALGLSREAAQEIDPLVLMGRVAARELNTLCTAFISENSLMERETENVAHPIVPRAQHSKYLGSKDAA